MTFGGGKILILTFFLPKLCESLRIGFSQLMIVNALLFVYRVLCGNKRPEPPNDSTPTAIVKKRRGLISDGNLKPVHKERADASVSSVNRLQRCRSMVEQSVSFHRSKGRRKFLCRRLLRFFASF